MEISAQQLAALLNGTIEGDPSVKITRPGKIESGQAGEICFFGNEKYEEYAYTTNASILLVANTFKPRQPIKPTLIRVENVYASLAFLLEKFGEQTRPTTATISERAAIDPSVSIGKNVAIGDFVIIEEGAIIGDGCRLYGQVYVGKNVSIGSNSIIYAGVKIYYDCKIGERCILQSGAVIGSDGFGFAPQADGTYKKIHHAGNVILEDDVEIGANTTIDRGSIGSTMIRRGVKLDNLIQVAHNVEIGENTVIAAQTGIAGSTKIGRNGRIGGQVGFGGHLAIGDFVQIQGQSGVINNQPDNVKLNGTPAIDFAGFMRSYVVFKTLPAMARQIAALEKRLKDGKGDPSV
jgi:UDP-3-O-[3-hydroxymyristoyl] glucosamine N-acyltransferase